MANTDVLDFIAGELHEQSSEKDKDVVLTKIGYLSK